MKLLQRLSALLAFSTLLSCLNMGSSPPWPAPTARQALDLWLHPVSALTTSLAPEGQLSGQSGSPPADGQLSGRSGSPPADEDTLVPELPVCVASQSWSAGELGRTILYHAKREGRMLTVGYFVYWTTERPWGKNALSYAVLPALFIDAFYSHLFFLFPGARHLLYGPGDIEGARVVYEQGDDGKWTPTSAVASDGLHNEVPLSPDDFVDPEGRVVLMTDVWSHQLGAPGARSFAENRGDALRCFAKETMAPMTTEIARAFRLGSPADPRRAAPAWRLHLPQVKVAAREATAIPPAP